MNQQEGISSAGIALVVVVLGAAAGGFYGWQQHGELERTRSALAEVRAAADKASAEARSAKSEAAAARKELDEQKATLAQLKSERDSAVVFLETEKGHGARLQEELTLARQQIAFLRSRASAASYPQFAPPTVVQPQMPLRVAPAHSGVQAIRAAPARAPSLEGQSPR